MSPIDGRADGAFQIGRVEAIFRDPVKSMRGRALANAGKAGSNRAVDALTHPVYSFIRLDGYVAPPL